jgi:hypothetical protein
MLGFGQQQQIQQQAQSSSINHPFGQDILHDAQPIFSITPSSLQKKLIIPCHRTVKAKFQFEAPNVLEDDVLNLISMAPYIANGLDNSIYLSNGRDKTKLIDLNVIYISSVKWNHPTGNNYLAIGWNDKV